VNEQSTAASVDICKIDVRNCDTPVIKDEIALPYGASPSYLGRAECARHRAALRYHRFRELRTRALASQPHSR